MNKRNDYITKMKHELDDLNVQMKKLEAKAEEVRAEVRHTYRAEMTKLHTQSELAMAKLKDLQASSENTWDSMVVETEKIRDAFVHSFSYFKSQV